jgi:hypothetical protein
MYATRSPHTYHEPYRRRPDCPQRPRSTRYQVWPDRTANLPEQVHALAATHPRTSANVRPTEAPNESSDAVLVARRLQAPHLDLTCAHMNLCSHDMWCVLVQPSCFSKTKKCQLR